MENPWLALPSRAPFVLDKDAKAIKNFNQSASDQHRIHDELLPYPYLGRVDASVILLNKNPGYKPYYDEELERKQHFRELHRKNLAHQSVDYPFFFLHPSIWEKYPDLCDQDGPGWWRQKLRWLIGAPGLDRETVANNLCCIEWFPYHSQKFRKFDLILESQKYGFKLVQKAMERDAIILIMRGEQLWTDAVKELIGYPKLARLKSPQNVSISARNCDQFDMIAEAIRRGKH